jgi:hypothetical protein
VEKNLSGLNNYRTLTQREKLIFLAGVFEGEGSFGYWGKESKANRYFRIQIRMCDEDIVIRFIDYFKLGCITTHIPKKKNWSKSWKWTVSGDKAIAVMLQMVPYLGIRRKEKFKECCPSFKQLPHLQKSYSTPLIKPLQTKTLQQS